MWSLCSVDFHTLTLQLPIQTPHSVVPELQVFVSSLKISAKRAHPRGPEKGATSLNWSVCGHMDMRMSLHPRRLRDRDTPENIIRPFNILIYFNANKMDLAGWDVVNFLENRHISNNLSVKCYRLVTN